MSRPIREAILDLGTYWAQKAADDSLGPHTAAHRSRTEDQLARRFPQVKGHILRFWRVGRVGLEPTTDGL
jgi:hypothetical protein